MARRHHCVLPLWVALLALLSCGPLCASAALPSVRAGHPRLLVTAADLPRLVRQVAAYPDEWKRLQGAALSAPEDANIGDARALTNAAFAYLITHEDRYLASAVALADTICRHHTGNEFGTPEAVFGLAVAYDWCYAGLTPAQRAELQEGMLRLADYLRDKLWRHADFSNQFALEKVWPFVNVGLALHGDRTDARGDDYLRLGSDYLRANLLPAANLMAGHRGGQLEGYGYDSWAYLRPLALTMEAWRTATGEDLFASCSATKYKALWDIYGLRPFDGKPEHFDDAHLGERWRESAEGVFIYLLAHRYRDGHAQWVGDQISRRDTDYLWPVLLWRDPDLSPRPPDDLPTARRFDGLGWVLMRSSWKPDATFASFQCGPFLTGHQHLDNNAFTLHKRSLLAIDPGVNAYGEGDLKTDYRTNYYSRTIAHNTITVYDPKETFPSGAWPQETPGGANDGGQLRLIAPERVQEITPGNRWDVGRIVAYVRDASFVYAVGDATRSYSPAKLKLFLRSFLFLPPDLFLIFDRVTSTDPSFRKAWLLHTIDEPVVNGAVATITNGPGRLTVRTVLPEHPVLTKIGGPGKECWVDGRNWPAIEENWTREAGAWRLEVSPSQPATEDLFLHVLETDGNEVAAPDAVSLLREKGAVGVRVLAQGKEYHVMFSTRTVSAHLRVTEGSRILVDRELK